MFDSFAGPLSVGFALAFDTNQSTLPHRHLLINSHPQAAKVLMAVKARRHAWIA
jgi:hypothetical protein